MESYVPYDLSLLNRIADVHGVERIRNTASEADIAVTIPYLVYLARYDISGCHNKICNHNKPEVKTLPYWKKYLNVNCVSPTSQYD